MMNRAIVTWLVLVIMIGVGAGFAAGASPEIKMTEEGVRYLVSPDKIVGGGPPKDGIPSIDQPKFVSVEEADTWIGDDELVMVLTHSGVERVYPLQILVWHEIVNDAIAGDPVLITYCPLCGSAIAYERTIDGEPVEFGTSGKLYNSNLVMYDRKTNTYWSQIDGLAIVGELTGERLVPMSSDTVLWGDWKGAHPDSQVLSRESGYNRTYGRDPYGSYYEDDSIWFPVEHKDDRLPPKTVIFAVEIAGVYKAYTESDIAEQGRIVDTVNGVPVRIERDPNGIVSVINQDTGDEIVAKRVFWFAWYAFHPDTLLYSVAST